MRFRISALGAHLGFHCPDEDLGAFLQEALCHLTPTDRWPPEDALEVEVSWTGAAEVTVAVDGREVYAGGPTAALARAMNVVNIAATRSAGHDLVLHCGVVSLGGRVVLLPGRPGAGKSTTTTALLLRGLGYLSDEAAPVTPDLRIRPYPKPVVIGPGSWPSVAGAARARIPLGRAALDAWWLDAEKLGSEVASAPLPVGAVVAPQYRAGAALEVEWLSRAEATAVLASNTFNIEDHGIAGIERIAALTGGVPCLRVSFGDVDEVVELLMRDLA